MDAKPRHAIWLGVEGGLLILLGVLALLSPLVAGVTVALMVGWLLVMAGLLGLASAVGGRTRLHAGWSLASAVIALVAGVVLLFNPLIGGLGLAALIGAYLLLDGITLVGLSLNHRKTGDRAWGWMLASGVFDLILAGVILALSAAGSTVLIGLVIGLDLIAAGAALLILRRSVNRDGGVSAGAAVPVTGP